MMKTTILLFSVLILFSCKETVNKEKDLKQKESTEQITTGEAPKKKTLSPHTNTMAMVGDAHIHIDYSSPGVRGRIIFGGLLAYDEVWQAGAHQATWIESNKDLIIAGKELKAGKYGFFLIPSEGDWTVIFNSHWNQHGKDEYDEKNDVVRFKVTPLISEEIQEHLQYTITKTDDMSGLITMSWDKVRLKFPFNIK